MKRRYGKSSGIRLATRAVLQAAGIFLCGFGAPAVSKAGSVRDTPHGPLVSLTVFNLPEPERMDTEARADRAVARAFEEAFPKLMAGRIERYRNDPARYGRHDWERIGVRVQAPSIPHVKDEPQVLMALAGGMAPDVLFVGARMIDDYVNQGLLYPLDRKEDGYLVSLPDEDRQRRIPEPLRDIVRRQGPDGRYTWALPYGGLLSRVVLYRRSLFTEAGLPEPHADWTWNEFLDACRRLTDPSRGRYGVYLSRDPREAWTWINFLRSAGGQALVATPADPAPRPAFASDAGVRALDFYIRLIAEPWKDAGGVRRHGYAWRDPLWPAASQKWERGEMGMLFAYAGGQILQRYPPELIGMAPLPVGPGGDRGAEYTSMMMGINAAIRDPVVRDAAWAYMQFYESDPALAIRAGTWIESGQGRLLHPDLLRRVGQEELARLTPRDWVETYDLSVHSGSPEPHVSGSHAIYEYLTQPLRAAEELALRERLPTTDEERQAVLMRLLSRSERRIREVLFDDWAEPPGRLQYAAAGLFVFIMPLLFAFLLRRASLPWQTQGSGISRKYVKGLVWMLLPALAAVLFWQYVPLVRGLWMAFLNYRITGASTWAGLNHFARVLWDGSWWVAVWNTIRYAAWSALLGVLPPLFLAVLLQEVPRGKGFLCLLFYLPATCSGLAVTLLWKSFYGPDESGVLNTLLMHIPAVVHLVVGISGIACALFFAARLGMHRAWAAAAMVLLAGAALGSAAWQLAAPALYGTEGVWITRLLAGRPEPVRWLADPRTAMLACIMPLAWAGLGPASLIYLAALKSIPEALYESADLDGAGFADKLFFIVCPSLRTLLWVSLVGTVSAAFLYATPHVLAMTGGAARTEVAGLYLFHAAFLRLRFDQATAMAWVLASLLIGFTVWQLKRLGGGQS